MPKSDRDTKQTESKSKLTPLLARWKLQKIIMPDRGLVPSFVDKGEQRVITPGSKDTTLRLSKKT